MVDISNRYLQLPVRAVNNVEPTTSTTSATPMVNKAATMPISAEMKVFVTGLRNNMTWKKLQSHKNPTAPSSRT